MENEGPVRRHENRVVMTKLPRDEFVRLKDMCDREDKSLNKKIRELINQEIHRVSGVAAEGVKRRFFVPSENRVVEMWEVEGEVGDD